MAQTQAQKRNKVQMSRKSNRSATTDQAGLAGDAAELYGQLAGQTEDSAFLTNTDGIHAFVGQGGPLSPTQDALLTAALTDLTNGVPDLSANGLDPMASLFDHNSPFDLNNLNLATGATAINGNNVNGHALPANASGFHDFFTSMSGAGLSSVTAPNINAGSLSAPGIHADMASFFYQSQMTQPSLVPTHLQQQLAITQGVTATTTAPNASQPQTTKAPSIRRKSSLRKIQHQESEITQLTQNLRLSTNDQSHSTVKAESKQDELSEDSEDDMEESVGRSSANSVPTARGKRKRITQACNTCNRRKVRCDGGLPCANCVRSKIECTYERPPHVRVSRAAQIQALESRLTTLESMLNPGNSVPTSQPAKSTKTRSRAKSSTAPHTQVTPKTDQFESLPIQTIRPVLVAVSNANKPISTFSPDAHTLSLKDYDHLNIATQFSTLDAIPSFAAEEDPTNLIQPIENLVKFLPSGSASTVTANELKTFLVVHFCSYECSLSCIHPRSFCTSIYERPVHLVQAILASGARFTDPSYFDLAEQLFDSSRHALMNDLDNLCLDNCHTALLLALYSIIVGRTNAAYLFAGIGTRMCLGLGYNDEKMLRELRKKGYSDLMVETCRRTFWSCAHMDVAISIAFERDPVWKDSDFKCLFPMDHDAFHDMSLAQVEDTPTRFPFESPYSCEYIRHKGILASSSFQLPSIHNMKHGAAFALITKLYSRIGRFVTKCKDAIPAVPKLHPVLELVTKCKEKEQEGQDLMDTDTQFEMDPISLPPVQVVAEIKEMFAQLDASFRDLVANLPPWNNEASQGDLNRNSQNAKSSNGRSGRKPSKASNPKCLTKSKTSNSSIAACQSHCYSSISIHMTVHAMIIMLHRTKHNFNAICAELLKLSQYNSETRPFLCDFSDPEDYLRTDNSADEENDPMNEDEVMGSESPTSSNTATSNSRIIPDKQMNLVAGVNLGVLEYRLSQYTVRSAEIIAELILELMRRVPHFPRMNGAASFCTFQAGWVMLGQLVRVRRDIAKELKLQDIQPQNQEQDSDLQELYQKQERVLQQLRILLIACSESSKWQALSRGHWQLLKSGVEHYIGVTVEDVLTKTLPEVVPSAESLSPSTGSEDEDI